MPPSRRKPVRAVRRTTVPPPVPVVSPEPAMNERPTLEPAPTTQNSETDQTEEQIRRILEAAYT
jgi:hypothetical protein